MPNENKPTIDKALYPDDVVRHVNLQIQSAYETGEKVAHWEDIQEYLIDKKIGWPSQIAPEHAGVHPSNRNSFGAGGSEAHVHGDQILQVGFSWKKASDATAAETPPHPFNAEAAAFNDKLVRLSQGLIPPLQMMRILSIGGAHTNAWLRAVKAGCRSAVPGRADEHGNLNAEQLSVGRPAFKEAVEKGLKWTVLHWQVPYVWPELLPLVQAALNVQAHGAITEVEVMLGMHADAALAEAAGKQPDWKAVQKAAAQNLPSCASYIDVLANYVKNNSGAGALLNDLSSFQKAFGCGAKGAARALGSEFISKVSGLNFGPGVKHPYVKNACLKANLQSKKVVDGVCKLLLPSHVAVLAADKKRALVNSAEKLMEDGRKLCDALSLADENRVVHIGMLDVRLILHICNKGNEGEGIDFKSFEDIAAAFVTDLQKDLGVLIDTSALSGTSMPSGSSGTRHLAHAAVNKIESIQQMKSIKYQASKEGFVINAMVVEKKHEGTIFEIKSISDDGAVLRDVTPLSGSTAEQTVSLGTLLTQWKVHKKKMCEELPGLDPSCDPLKSSAFAVEAAKGVVYTVMRDMLSTHRDPKVQLFHQPYKCVAAADIPKKALTLIPASLRIDRKASPGCVSLGNMSIIGEEVAFYIAPQIVPPLGKNDKKNANPWVTPFWFVATTDKEKEVNMVLSWQVRRMGEMEINMPIITNTVALHKGNELKRLAQAVPPPAKNKRKRE